MPHNRAPRHAQSSQNTCTVYNIYYSRQHARGHGTFPIPSHPVRRKFLSPVSVRAPRTPRRSRAVNVFNSKAKLGRTKRDTCYKRATSSQRALFTNSNATTGDTDTHAHMHTRHTLAARTIAHIAAHEHQAPPVLHLSTRLRVPLKASRGGALACRSYAPPSLPFYLPTLPTSYLRRRRARRRPRR